MYSNNSQLAATVRTRMIDTLGAHLPADEARIVVDVIDDCAVLLGSVHTWDQHEALERAALETPGITRVDNQLALLVEAHLADSSENR